MYMAKQPVIVLHHGLFGFARKQLAPGVGLEYFHRISGSLESDGHSVVATQVSPVASIARRAEELAEQVEQLDGAPIIVLAHSMGGLDARYMLSRLHRGRDVAALVTIGTPHHGTSFADWVVRQFGKKLKLEQFIDRMDLNAGAFADLTRKSSREFTTATPERTNVRYFSIAGMVEWLNIPAFMLHSHIHVLRNEGANDGVVPVSSARYGEFLGVWPAHHLQLVNRRLGAGRRLDMKKRYCALVRKVINSL